MIQDGQNGEGASLRDHATHEQNPSVSAVPAGIANAEIRGQPDLHPWHSIAEELLARGWSVEDLAIRMAIPNYDAILEEIRVNMLTLDLYRTVGPNDHRCTIGIRAGTSIAEAFGVSPEMIMGLDIDWRAAAKAMETRQGQDPQGLDGDSHDSALGNADLPNTPHAPEKE